MIGVPKGTVGRRLKPTGASRLGNRGPPVAVKNDGEKLAAMLEEKVPGAKIETYTDANGATFDNYYTILLAPVDFNDYL